MKTRKASLHDVASQAGVSVSTVSRYLNGQLALRSETENRVLDAVDQVGYVRTMSSTAQRIRSEAPTARGVIGLILPMVANSYFGSIADAVVRAADRQSLDVVFASTLNHSQKQLDYVEILTGRDVSGIIYAGNYASNPALAEAISAGMPVVVIDEALTDVPPVDSVLVDDYAGAYNATSYLAALGHESVALVTGPASLRSVEERTRGWRDALTHAEIDAGKQLRISGPFSVQFGAAALSSILAARERPTAVFAASDPIALGMMVAARSLGMDIPNDLSVVGFDGLPESELISPRLTTVRTPLETMAEEAISLLTARMAGADHEPTTTVVAVSLTVRDSAAGPRIHSLS